MPRRGEFKLEVHSDPRPGLVVERGPHGTGVGDWVPKVKHTLLAKYISAASGAMRRWPERVFIDPFCGPGRVQVEGEAFDRDGGSLVAWRQAQECKVPFTRMLLGDLDAKRAAAAQMRLAALGAPVQVLEGPAEATVQRMVAEVPRGALCLAYLDPYNLSLLSFDMIRTLAKLPKVDFAVHFSTMDLLRNVDAELNPERARFDEVAPGWRDALRGISKQNLPVAFQKYWISLVQGLGFEFSQAITLVNNSRGNEIYRLVFFARHNLPIRLWGDVAKSPTRDLFAS
jgi:three-Cys-motif partner protein